MHAWDLWTVCSVCIDMETKWKNFGADNCSKLSNIYACAQWFAYFEEEKTIKTTADLFNFMEILLAYDSMYFFFSVSLGHEKPYVFFLFSLYFV